MSDRDELPREPSAYRPSIHFGERFRDFDDGPSRHLDGEIVRTCIVDGTIAQAGGDDLKFQAWVGGVRYSLIVDPESRLIKTGYPSAIDDVVALESGRWSRRQLEDIRERLDMH